jgi:hypothetical protein
MSMGCNGYLLPDLQEVARMGSGVEVSGVSVERQAAPPVETAGGANEAGW